MSESKLADCGAYYGVADVLGGDEGLAIILDFALLSILEAVWVVVGYDGAFWGEFLGSQFSELFVVFVA